jgi:hypothetical protein
MRGTGWFETYSEDIGTYELARIVQEWIDNPSTNHGLLFRIDDSYNEGAGFYSRDHSNTSLRPHLIVNYDIPAPSIKLELYRVSDTGGTEDTNSPGTAKGSFAAGETVRVTLRADNTGDPADVKVTLNIRNPDKSTLLYNSYDQATTDGGGLEDNTNDSPLTSSEGYDYYSFDKIIPADAPIGSYDLLAAMRNQAWTMLWDTSAPQRSDADWDNAWLAEQFEVVEAHKESLTYSSDHFTIHYWVCSAGTDADCIAHEPGLPPIDANADGLPDYIERLAVALEASYEAFKEAGFDMPGGARIGVEVKHIASGALGVGSRLLPSGACSLLPNAPPLCQFWIDNDIGGPNNPSDENEPYQWLGWTAAHELGHWLQPALAGKNDWVKEGLAEALPGMLGSPFDEINGYIVSLGQFPWSNRSLYDPGNEGYHAALFWRYVYEHVGGLGTLHVV